MPPKAVPSDYLGRFREIVSDPLNLLIRRHPSAGVVEDGLVSLHNGLKVPIQGKGAYYGDFSNILIVNRGVHEPLEEYVFQRLLETLPRAPRMLELGAYWGHYSMWLKSVLPQGEVVLVEPGQMNIAAGKANFVLNGLEGEFIQASVGRGAFEVDAFLQERGIERLDVLHADIQGAELEMLDGAGQSLRNGVVRRVLVSTHSQKLHNRCAQALESAGFRVEVSSDFDHETTSCDGLLFASRREDPPVLSGFQPMGREEICSSSPERLMDHLLASAGRARASA
jgi:predicted O-methyltransferase YrrM